MEHLNLSHLETLINDALQQRFLNPDQLDIDAVVFEISHEKKRISEVVFQLGDADKAAYYIRIYQRQLIRLIDLVVTASYKLQYNTDDEHAELCNRIYKSLEEVLCCLEKNYACYLDSDCKIPMSYLFSIQEHFQQEIQVISSADIDLRLKAILLKPFNDFIAAEGNDFFYSYQDTLYLNTLLVRLNKLVIDPFIDELKLQHLLVELDFNDPDYFGYVTNKIKEEIGEMTFTKAKIEQVFLLQRNLNEVFPDRGLYFKRLREPLQQQLQLWLEGQLSYLEKSRALSDTSHIPAELLQWKDFKIVTSLSISELGRFWGLQLEQKLLLNENKKELSNFIAFFFRSIHSHTIKPDHVRNSFYRKSVALKEALQDILGQLMNRLRK